MSADVVVGLDRLIEGKRSELDRATAVAETIPALRADLATLERARAIAAGGNGIAHSVSVSDTVSVSVPEQVSITLRPRPLTDVVLDVVRLSGRDITLDDIMADVSAQFSDPRRNTVIGHLSRFIDRGRVERTAPRTYRFVK